MKSPETGSAVIRKFIYINELLLPVSCLTSPDVSRLRYLSDPVNALERGGSRGRNDQESACSDRPCMRKSRKRNHGIGELARPAVRPTDPAGFVFVLQVPVRDLRSTFADGKEPEPVAPRAGSNLMPAEPGWNGKEGQSPSPAVAGVTFERRQVRASGADDEHHSARPADLLAASHGPGRTARAEDEVDLPRRIAVRSCILPG